MAQVDEWSPEGGEIVRDDMSVFDKIEMVASILEHEELTESDLAQLQQLLAEIKEETEEAEGKLVSFFDKDVFSRLKKLFPKHPFFKELKGKVHFIDSLELLVGGKESFKRILANIAFAKKSIHITMFLWRDDEIGNQIAQALLDAADRGVEITIEKDALASTWEYQEQVKQSFFHKGSVEGQIPNPLVQKLLGHPKIHIESSIRKDHSKYLIFDEETIITGGVNIGDEYDRDEFHDYMVEMKSPLLAKKLRERVAMEDDPDIQGSAIEFVVNTKTEKGRQFEIEGQVLSLLRSAKEHVIIEMAYFGDEDITEAIIETVRRGVRVDIILPGQANIQDSLNKRTIQELLDAVGPHGNLSIYFFPRMVHAKVINIDGKYTFMGSANLNLSATEKLGETNILVSEENCPFSREILSALRKDMKASEKISSPPKLTWDSLKARGEAFVQTLI